MYNLAMSNKTKRKLYIPRGDAFLDDLACYEFEEEFEGVRRLMHQRRFTVGESGTTYRTINHWNTSNILPEGVKNETGWKKFTLPELVWLQIVQSLRGFGLSLEKIAKAKNDVMVWYEKEQAYLFFECYLAKALFSESSPYVVVLQDGEAALASAGELEASRMICGEHDALLISLKSALEVMGLATVEAGRRFALSPKEIELITTLRWEGGDKVTLKIDATGEITEIENVSKAKNPKAVREVLHRLKEQKAFGQVVTKIENGVQQSVEISKRKKL